MQDPQARLVVCLCAAWCYVCNDFRGAFDALARAHPAARFRWVDVEDDSALIGEVDIENFPTLAVYRDGVPVFFGVVTPQPPVIARTLAALFEGTPRPVAAPAQIVALPRALEAPG
ncbi:MAG: thioredoxin family protein [Burkholderiales bacterium]